MIPRTVKLAASMKSHVMNLENGSNTIKIIRNPTGMNAILTMRLIILAYSVFAELEYPSLGPTTISISPSAGVGSSMTVGSSTAA